MNGMNDMNQTIPTLNTKSPVNTARRILTSNMFLFVVIAASISLLSAMINAFSSAMDFESLLEPFFEAFGEEGEEALEEMLEEIEDFEDLLNTAIVGGKLVGLLPTILTVLGYWLFFMGARNSNNALVVNGATIFQVMLILQSIGPMAGVVVCVIVAIAALEDAVAASIIMLIVAAIFFLFFWYFSRFAKVFKGLKTTMRTNVNVVKISKFVIGMNWVSAVCTIISALATLSMSFMGAVSAALSAACTIIITLMLSDYKETMGDPTPDDIARAKAMGR